MRETLATLTSGSWNCEYYIKPLF